MKDSPQHFLDPLDLVKLRDVMNLTSGRSEIIVGLIDGPVAIGMPNLPSKNIREVPGTVSGKCASGSSAACAHGTLVASILVAERGSAAPAICPSCTLLLRPIFEETTSDTHADPAQSAPTATPGKLADAIVDCIRYGARVINLSAALGGPALNNARELEQALDFAAIKGVVIVAAAGNQTAVGSSVITRHPWVIPVAACDTWGRPLHYSNLGSSIAKRGVSAPGENVLSLSSDGKPRTFAGTSAAAPFVTGTIALLWSEFPNAAASEIVLSVTQAQKRRRTSIVPPLLDALGSYRSIQMKSSSAFRTCYQ
jgi:subtilisin family serine protease